MFLLSFGLNIYMNWIISSVLQKIQTYSQGKELQLAQAIAIDDLKTVNRLLAEGVDPNAKIVGKKLNPLIFLVFTKNWFSLPPDSPYDYGHTLYNITAKTECLHLLLKYQANPNVRDTLGRTVMEIAITWCMPDIVRLLLNFSADPNFPNGEGVTPLMKTVILGVKDARPMTHKQRIAADLIDSGADLDAQGANGMTALMYAARHGRMEMADLLVTKGASLSIKNKQGKTAYDLIPASLYPDRRNYLQKILQEPQLASPVSGGKYYQPPEGDRLLSQILDVVETYEQ